MGFEELTDKEYAIDFLAGKLNNGEVALFVGAGTSKGFGLPDWSELINSLLSKVGLENLDGEASAEDLQDAADDVLEELDGDQGKLIEMISEILYPDRTKVNVNDIYNNHLLISVASLMIGSKRGRIKKVVTLNYDSMLEWFLSLFGFVTRSITKLPSLEGDEDVRIYHPHGFIPHPQLNLGNSDFVILGMDEANKRLGTKGEPWLEKIRQILECNICIFVGMSENTFSDRLIAPLVIKTGTDLKLERPLGIWIHKGSLLPQKRRKFLRANVIPIEIEVPIEISKFLLKISEKASKEIRLK